MIRNYIDVAASGRDHKRFIQIVLANRRIGLNRPESGLSHPILKSEPVARGQPELFIGAALIYGDFDQTA